MDLGLVEELETTPKQEWLALEPLCLEGPPSLLT